MRFVLVHSPLVGPSTWRWTADELRAADHEVVVPDLREAVAGADPEAVIAAAVAGVPATWPDVAIVGHSGAGSLLPSIGGRLGGRARRLVFVDAGLPPVAGPFTPGRDAVDQLRALAVGGVLPRWSTWWGAGVMETLVPEGDRRDEIDGEMTETPLAFFEAALEAPDRWWDRPGAFRLLSEPYREDAARARALGWPVVDRLGGHLDIVNDPGGIARTIADLAP
jgi:pimeloyl-ACP methyl ester carboxylesterase